MNTKPNTETRSSTPGVKEIAVVPNRIWNGDAFRGTAVFYSATPDSHFAYLCDFAVDTMKDSRRQQTRLARLMKKKRGKSLPRIGDDQLKNEVLLLLGPEVSAVQVVATLERLAAQIKTNGMMIGRRNKDDELRFETISGEIVG